jgi:hypothetical protein
MSESSLTIKLQCESTNESLLTLESNLAVEIWKALSPFIVSDYADMILHMHTL